MTKKELYILNPGGNITAIVRKKTIKTNRLHIEKTIKQKYPKVEQVGFWLNSRNKTAVARLEMTDAEFCLNAIRSLAYLIFKEQNLEKFFIEVPAIKKNIKIEIYKGYPKVYVPRSIIVLQKNNVSFPTISYVIEEKEKSLSEIKSYFMEESIKNKIPALGYISYTRQKNTTTIKPFVWIKSKKSFVSETGCGSGSIAIAVFLKKTNLQKIKQPSRSIYSVDIEKNQISIYGKIQIEC